MDDPLTGVSVKLKLNLLLAVVGGVGHLLEGGYGVDRTSPFPPDPPDVCLTVSVPDVGPLDGGRTMLDGMLENIDEDDGVGAVGELETSPAADPGLPASSSSPSAPAPILVVGVVPSRGSSSS